MNILIVFLGGGLGAILRYIIGFLFKPSNGHYFPYNTLIVNALGCLLIGIVFNYFFKSKINDSVFLFLTVGVLGGFTTFSSFGLEFVLLIKNGHLNLAFSYLLLTNIIGLAFVYLSFILIK